MKLKESLIKSCPPLLSGKTAKRGVAKRPYSLAITGVLRLDVDPFTTQLNATRLNQSFLKIIILTLALSGTVATVQAEDKVDKCRRLVKEKNYQQAFPICQPVAEQEDAAAIFHLEWYIGAAEQGDVKAQYQLDNRPVSFNCASKAEQGDVKAQYQLGWMYANGELVEQDKQQAVAWYQKAAEQGHTDAQYQLGQLYANGDGVKQDKQQAAIWLSLAAINEDEKYKKIRETVAKHLTADELRTAKQQAFSIGQKAAEQGHASAQFKLGVMYSNGEGVVQDVQQAATWYQKAAEQGHASAQLFLGWLYENGEGVTEDKQKAVMWYRQAAEQGYPYAQLNLGWMYFNGEGVVKDNQEAYIWFSLAAINGGEWQGKARNAVAEHLTADELSNAQQMLNKRQQAIEAVQANQ